MRTYQSAHQFQTEFSGSERTILTIGSFDGVHLGHRKLVQEAMAQSIESGADVVVLTFSPHPSEVLFPQKKFFRLFNNADQMNQMGELGVHHFVVEKFTQELASKEALDFLENYLVACFRPRSFVVGYDFAFGKGKEGGIDFLEKNGKKYGFDCHVVDAVKVDDQVVSSSLIREFLLEGKVEEANNLLARPFYLEGIVEEGAQRGRDLGFPTANIRVDQEFWPKSGVYATKTYLDDCVLAGVSNLGLRPTVKEDGVDDVFLETHLFDFDKKIYGQRLRTEFLNFLRPEKKFSSLEELKTQIAKDAVSARELLK